LADKGLKGDSLELKKDELLFRAGDSVTRMFLIEHGEIQLVRPLSHGDEVIAQRAESGAWLAEASLFADCYHCDARAIQNTSLLSYPRKQVLQLLHSEPEFSLQLCSKLASEIMQLRTRLEVANISSAEERVLTWLKLNAVAQVLTIERPLKQIASELGLAHETLYRTLKRLEAKQLISRNSNQILLLVN